MTNSTERIRGEGERSINQSFGAQAGTTRPFGNRFARVDGQSVGMAPSCADSERRRNPVRSSPSISAVLHAQLGVSKLVLRPATALADKVPGKIFGQSQYLHTVNGLAQSCMPLLELAVRRCRKLAPDDPASEALGSYYAQRMAKSTVRNRHSFARLLITGRESVSVLGELASRTIADLVGAQYYWIEHDHPVTLLGYLLVLDDGASVCWSRDPVEAGARNQTIEPLCTLDEPTQQQVRRADDLVELLDTLPLSEKQQTTVVHSALRTVEELVNLYMNLGGVEVRPAHGYPFSS